MTSRWHARWLLMLFLTSSMALSERREREREGREREEKGGREGSDGRRNRHREKGKWRKQFTMPSWDSREDATSDTEIIHQMLSQSGYDWRVRPPGLNLSAPGNHGPVIVKVNMMLRSISKIDDVNMEYSVQLTFREEWIDGRLAYGVKGRPDYDWMPDFVILPAGEQIWMPDSFFQNEKNAQRHTIDKPNVMIRVHKNGTVLYSVRISMVLSCPMHLEEYPMDVQMCLIEMGSYAYTTNDIEYLWKESSPVQLKAGLAQSLPSFQLIWLNTTYCTSHTSTGVYSCLRAVLELKRQFSYYLLQLYIPSTMLVIVSWVSFWLDRSAVPARVTLGVTTLLTMTTQASGINAKLPPVSYTKAIDIWIGACLMFIFGALLEFAFVTYISSRNFYRSSKLEPKCTLVMDQQPPMEQPLIIPNNHHLRSSVPYGTNNCCTPSHNVDPRKGEVWVRQPGGQGGQMFIMANRDTSWLEMIKQAACFRWIKKQLSVADRAKKADLMSRLLFPMMFFLFNIAYWFRYYRADVIRTGGFTPEANK